MSEPLRKYLTIAAVAALASGTTHARADNVSNFYSGKVITVLVGYPPGGGYDLYARELAKYMSKYIPGDPTIIVQNMPGAGGLRVTNYLYQVAPKDGTAIGTFSRAMPLSPLLGVAGTKFDPLKFYWLGSATKDSWVCISWKNSAFKSWKDIFVNEFKVGGEAKGSDPDTYALVVKNAFNAKIKLISGYAGTGDVVLAMQRHEVDGICGYSYTTLRALHPEWIANKQLNFIVQGALEPNPDLPNVPFLLNEAKTDMQKEMLELALAPQAMARPFALPPGVPKDRAQALRHAFDQVMKDPDFLAEMKKLQLDVDPMPGDKVFALLQQVYRTPKDVVQQTRGMMGY